MRIESCECYLSASASYLLIRDKGYFCSRPVYPSVRHFLRWLSISCDFNFNSS